MSKTDSLLAEILDELKKMNKKIESFEEKISNMMPKLNINPLDIFKSFMSQGASEE